jgi:hypothetical protein
MFQLTHWLHVFWVSKTVGHHFWSRLMVEAETEQGRKTEKNKSSHPTQERENQGPS